ncbi:hypothetical protein PG994_004505 [Apiospora phragmitis]|uniref:Uncharacterized protein n=1 Tax=Apiospora phragmitis TaxID=2905665 RepID=A0ABR1VQT1_9PEZI
MSENRWEDPARLNYNFSLADLEREWRSNDNSWAKESKWGQKQLIRGFVSAKSRQLLGNEADKLLRMSPRGAEKLWKDLHNGLGQKPREPCSDAVMTGRLLDRLDHCGLAIELAAAYIIENQTFVAE